MAYYSAIASTKSCRLENMEIIMVSEISQTEKNKCHVISLLCGI